MTTFYIGDDLEVVEGAGREVAVVALGGEVDYEVSPQLKAHLSRAIGAGRHRLVLDLSDVTFIDSTAIGVIAGALERLDPAAGESIAIVSDHDKVLEILEITGLDSVISVHATREEALSAVTPAR